MTLIPLLISLGVIVEDIPLGKLNKATSHISEIIFVFISWIKLFSFNLINGKSSFQFNPADLFPPKKFIL